MASERLSTDDYVSALPVMDFPSSGGLANMQPAAPPALPAGLSKSLYASRIRSDLRGLSDDSMRFLAPAIETFSEELVADESLPIRARFLRIIEDGLTSVHEPSARPTHVIVIGAGCAGLTAARELKRGGLSVTILEASHRVGGRVKTIREPFAAGLHGEGGAMRLPADHVLVAAYLQKLGLDSTLEPFQQANRLIYLNSYGSSLAYEQFEQLLERKDRRLLALFPGLRPAERGKTADTLWAEAVTPVTATFFRVLEEATRSGQTHLKAHETAYLNIHEQFGGYTLRSYLEEKAGWSQGAILLYDLANAHVVLSNSFVESWKDGFLSSERGGAQASMQQLADGMEALPLSLAHPTDGFDLTNDIHYGCVVRSVERRRTGTAGGRIRVTYDSAAGGERAVNGDYVVFAIPFTVANLLRIKPSFGSAKRTAIRTLRYVEVTKVLVQFKARWWERYLAERGQGRDGGVITDLPIRYLMFPFAGSAQFQHGQERGVVMASYVFEQDATELGALTEADRLRVVARDLRTIFGSQVIDDYFEVGASQVWPATETSGGSAFAYFGPGQRLELFRGIIEPEWNGTAHFAGEHASYSHGWIEGAIESGLRVADQIYERQTR